jgi:polyphosphate glucokinase
VAEGLSWIAWARRVDAYLQLLQRYFWPDLLIIGGGVSKRSDKFIPHLTVAVPVVPAQLGNEAGIIGAALAHAQTLRRQDPD